MIVRRKRMTTALWLSASVIVLVATLAVATGRHTGIQTVSAKEPAPSSREDNSATVPAIDPVPPGPQASPTPLETLIDRCSTSVRIEPALIFSQDQGGMVPGNQAPIRLRRPPNNASTGFSEKRSVGLTSSGRFKWFCGSNANNQGGTLEHSNCPHGTNSMRALLGPNRLLKIECRPD